MKLSVILGTSLLLATTVLLSADSAVACNGVQANVLVKVCAGSGSTAGSACQLGVQEYVPGGFPPYSCAGIYNDGTQSCLGLYVSYSSGPDCYGLP